MKVNAATHKLITAGEASIRRDPRLDDAEGTACLPNAAIFEELARMRVVSLEQIKTNQAAKIEKLKKRVKKLEGKKKKRTHGLKRRAAIDVDEDLSLIDETTQDQRRMNDEDLFGVNDLDGDEVIVDVTTSKNVEQDATFAEKEVSDVADEVVTTAESVEGIIAATAPQISKDDVTLAQTLMEIKAAKPKEKGVTIQEPSEFRTTSSLQSSQPPHDKDKAREKNKANRDVIKELDDVQATIDADRQLAEQLQAQEREQLSIKERSKLLAKLVESKRKYFVAKRAEEIKNKPPTKA
nr:hypothetical protein [Tanacetum cinerariifolium]